MKSANAYRTISEVSTELEVPQHVLRFWETKFPQIRPLKRGGGRRYYRPEDVDLLRRIQGLLYREGYTIKGVQRLLRGPKAGGVGNADEEGDEAESADAEDAQEVSEDLLTLALASTTVDPSAGRAPDIRQSVIREVLSELRALRDLLRSGDEQGPK